MTPAEGYAICRRLAEAHYENFPVASRLLPRGMRPHVAAVYAFARAADDFADEDGYVTAERLALLGWWRETLRASLQHAAPPPLPGGLSPAVAARAAALPTEAIFVALAASARDCRLPLALLEDLLSAFTQDVTVRRYRTWADVLDYCRRSANPVGRLVLRIAGHDDGLLDRSSDALCTALQLTNFWQDLAIDWRRGRLYVPAEEWTAAGAVLEDLDAGRLTPSWRAALGGAAARTRALFADGRAVCDGVGGRLRYELRLTWLGASRVLDRLEASGFDPFPARPALGRSDLLPLAWQALTWRRHPPAAAPSPRAATREP